MLDSCCGWRATVAASACRRCCPCFANLPPPPCRAPCSHPAPPLPRFCTAADNRQCVTLILGRQGLAKAARDLAKNKPLINYTTDHSLKWSGITGRICPNKAPKHADGLSFVVWSVAAGSCKAGSQPSPALRMYVHMHWQEWGAAESRAVQAQVHF